MASSNRTESADNSVQVTYRLLVNRACVRLPKSCYFSKILHHLHLFQPNITQTVYANEVPDDNQPE